MASRSLNRVIIIGNLTRDPELKYTPAGTAVCTFGVATNRAWTTSEGQTKEDTQYHRIVAWQKLAELCSKLLTKGRKIYMEGRLTYRSFTGKDGQQKTVAEIVLDDFIVFSDGKKGSEEALMGAPQNSDSSFSNEEEFAGISDDEHNEPAANKDKEQIVEPDDIPF